MVKHSLSREDMIEEKYKIDDIDYNIKLMKSKLLEKVPSQFSISNIIDAFFGALLIGMTFVLKGALVRTALNLTKWHLIAIVIFTISIIFVQVYFLTYRRLKDKGEHSFGRYVFKRMATILLVAIVVSVSLVYLLAVNLQAADFLETLKIITTLWMACAIGSAIPGLLKSY